MKKFYKNKAILIAISNLILCFNLHSKTMAMNYEKIDVSGFIDTINELANKTTSFTRKTDDLSKPFDFKKQNADTGLNSEKLNNSIKKSNNLADKTWQDKTTSFTRKTDDLSKPFDFKKQNADTGLDEKNDEEINSNSIDSTSSIFNENLNLPNTGQIELNISILDEQNKSIKIMKEVLNIDENALFQLEPLHEFAAEHPPFENIEDENYKKFREYCIYLLGTIFKDENFKNLDHKLHIINSYYFTYLFPLCHFTNQITYENLNLPNIGQIKLNISILDEQNKNIKIMKEVLNIDEDALFQLEPLHEFAAEHPPFENIEDENYKKFREYCIYLLGTIFKDENFKNLDHKLHIINSYFFTYLFPLCHFTNQITYENLNLPAEGKLNLNNIQILNIDKDKIYKLEPLHEFVAEHERLKDIEDENYKNLVEQCYTTIEKIFKEDLKNLNLTDKTKIIKTYFIKYLHPLLHFNNLYKSIIDDEQINLPNKGQIILFVRPTRKKLYSILERHVINLTEKDIYFLKHNVHIPFWISASKYKFESEEDKEYQNLKLRTLQWIKKLLKENNKSIAYFNTFLKPLCNFKKQQNNENKITDISENFDVKSYNKLAREFDNNITDISENFDEEHFNKLLNLPKVGTKLVVKPDKSTGNQKPEPQDIIIGEDIIEPLKDIHIKALIESLQIGQFESDSTKKCVRYRNFKANIYNWLKKIFRHIDVINAYFKQFIKPLLNFKEQKNNKNNNIIDIDENSNEEINKNFDIINHAININHK